MFKKSHNVVFRPNSGEKHAEDAWQPSPPIVRSNKFDQWCADHSRDVDIIVDRVTEMLTSVKNRDGGLRVNHGVLKNNIEAYLYKTYDHDVM
jgi:isocitrate dehydrogenase kinase/phosphatase